MPKWFALVAMVVLAGFTFLEGRAVMRSVKSGVLHRWFGPHPAFVKRVPKAGSPTL